jgi:phosphatidylinositol alpha-mannosyltransferase
MSRLPSDVRVWVGGDGPETECLRERWGGDQRVEWLGRLDDEQVARRLRGADVFCAPSLHGESFGVVLLEAMAAQTPIVASDLPGYRNVARAGQDALLVPPDDAKALADALVEVLEHPMLGESLVASGEARAAEFSMDLLAERYLDLFEASTTAGR